MPWKPSDAKKHKKGLSKSQAEKWAKIANSVRNDCIKDGGSEKSCDAKAIRIANSKVGTQKHTEKGGEKSVKTIRKKVPQSALRFIDSEPAKFTLELNEENKLEAFSMEAYSGKIIKNHWLWGDLAIDVEGLSFNKGKIPILEQHELDRKIGFSKRPETKDNIFFPQIKLLNNEIAQEFGQNLQDGFPYQASISVRPTVIEELGEKQEAKVNGFTMKGPGTIFRKALFKEASAVVFGYDPRTSVTPLSEDDEIEMEILNLSEEESRKKTKNKPNGGTSMFEKLKDENPELYNEIMAALAEKDTEITSLSTERDNLKDQVTSLTDQITSLTEENTSLRDENKENEKRITKLEEAEEIRKQEKLRLAQEKKANDIIQASFKENGIPERLQTKIKKYLDFSDYIGEDKTLDEEGFTKFVKEEVESWKTDLKDLSTDTILGAGDNHNDVDFTEQEAEELSDRLVNMVHPKKDK